MNQEADLSKDFEGMHPHLRRKILIRKVRTDFVYDNVYVNSAPEYPLPAYAFLFPKSDKPFRITIPQFQRILFFLQHDPDKVPGTEMGLLSFVKEHITKSQSSFRR